MEKFKNFISENKMVVIIGAIILVLVLVVLLLPKHDNNATEAVDEPKGPMTIEELQSITDSATLLYPKTNEDFRYNEYDSFVEITECLTKKSDITVPAFIEDKPVLKIRENAFSKSTPQNVNIEDGIIVISPGAFYENKTIVSVTIPDSVRYLGESAFAECEALEKIHLGANVNTISANCFSSSSKLSSINLPDSLEKIDTRAFYACDSLQDITIPNSVTFIGEEAFIYCEKLNKIVISNNVNNIPENFCYSCPNLMSVYISEQTNPEPNTENVEETTDKTDEKKNNVEAAYSRNISATAFSDCPNLAICWIPKDFSAIDESAFEGSTNNLTIFGYTSSAAAQFAADKRINFLILTEDNFDEIADMLIQIKSDLTTIRDKYLEININNQMSVPVNSANAMIEELSNYAKALMDSNSNVAGFGRKDDIFSIQFVNSQKISLPLMIDSDFFKDESV